MVRILVISLVVANLVLLGFELSKPEEQAESPVEQSRIEDSNVPTIHLVDELMQDWELLSGNRKCFSLGPFRSSEDRDQVREQLLDVSAYISERETQAQVEKGYWVFLPPFESLLEANRALLSLQALGLKDVSVIYEGNWAKSVSLGYFLRQRNANRRRQDLEDRGYEPLMRVQRQLEPRYWLDYEQNPGSVMVTIDMQDRPNDFMQRSMPCPENETVAESANS